MKENYQNRIFHKDQGSFRKINGRSVEHPEGIAELPDDPHDMNIKTSRTPLGDEHIGLRRDYLQTEMNILHRTAVESQGWIDTLKEQHDKSPVRKIGRGLMNLMGRETSTQKDIRWHEGRVERYRASVGLEQGESLSIKNHIELRDTAIDARFGDALRRYLDSSLAGEDEARREDTEAFIKKSAGYDSALSVEENLARLDSSMLLQLHDEYMHSATDPLPSEQRRRAINEKKVDEAKDELDKYEAMRILDTWITIEETMIRSVNQGNEEVITEKLKNLEQMEESARELWERLHEGYFADDSLFGLLKRGGMRDVIRYISIKNGPFKNIPEVDDIWRQVLHDEKRANKDA